MGYTGFTLSLDKKIPQLLLKVPVVFGADWPWPSRWNVTSFQNPVYLHRFYVLMGWLESRVTGVQSAVHSMTNTGFCKLLSALAKLDTPHMFTSALFFIKNVVAVAAYNWLTSRSQTTFPNNEIESHSIPRAQPHLCRVPPDVHFDSRLASDRMRIWHSLSQWPFPGISKLEKKLACGCYTAR